MITLTLRYTKLFFFSSIKRTCRGAIFGWDKTRWTWRG